MIQMKSLVSIVSCLLFVLFTHVCGNVKFKTNDAATVSCPSGSNCTVDVTSFRSVNQPGGGAVVTNDYVIFGSSGELTLGGCYTPPCVLKCNDECECLEDCSSITNITVGVQDDDVGVDDTTPTGDGGGSNHVDISTGKKSTSPNTTSTAESVQTMAGWGGSGANIMAIMALCLIVFA